MKKKIFFISILVLLVLLTGCGSSVDTTKSPVVFLPPEEERDATWELIKDDGNVYILFSPNHQPVGDGFLWGAQFDSIEAAQKAFLNQELSKEYIGLIKSSFQWTEKGYVICDIENLYEPILENGTAYSQIVIYSGYYTYFYSGLGSISVYADNAFERRLSEYHESQECPFAEEKIVRKEYVDRYGETATLFESHTGETKVYYTLKDIDYTILVEENYQSTKKEDGTWVTNSYAETIRYIYDFDSKQDFVLTLSNPDELPSVEWLQNISLRLCSYKQ